MKKANKIFSTLLFLFFSVSTWSQQTGQFDISISFSSPSHPNQTRTLSFNVPSNYTPSKQYKLFVGLHGQGSSSQNFCAAPFTNGFLGDVIMVCPSQGVSMSGFCDNTGEDDGIMDAAVAKAVSLYNIDPSYVIITGFSFGGRCGLRYGLNDYQKYRGMMLFAPAVNSIAHAQNNPYEWNYPNAKFIPLCMVTGANDSYAPIDQEVANQYGIAGAGNMVSYTIIPNFGHGVPPAQSYYVNCMNFIDAHPGTMTGQSELSPNDHPGYMVVYPNPVMDNAQVMYELSAPVPQNAQMIVTDIMGREIERVDLYGPTGIVHLKENLLPGIYIVRLISDGKEAAEPVKLIKAGRD